MNNNLPMYHIHTIDTHYDNLWVPGSTFAVERSMRNRFLKYYDTATIGIHTPNSPVIPISSAIVQLKGIPDELWHQNCRTLLDQAAKAIKEMGTYIREIIFEEIRKTEFSDLPSRLGCIWLCDAEGIPYWWQRMSSGTKVILEVNATGTFHRASQSFLVSDSISHDELRSYARRYWKGEDVGNKTEEEVLFNGEVHVLRQFNGIVEFTSR